MTSVEEQRVIIEQDRLNQLTPFNEKTQFLPADLFTLKGFRGGQPVYERNPRWHDDKGYFIGRPKK